jgi:signal transduction histidine kinase/CheY-like chemotaxis protein
LLHHTKADGRPYPVDDCPSSLTLKDGVARHVHDEILWRKDGTSFPVEYFVAPMLNEEGGITGVAFTFRDITERMAIDKMKNEFVSTVSHELRTPLTSIRGALGLLGSGMLGSVGEKGQRMLEIAISNTDRLVRLINDILDLERIDSGRVELNRTDVVAGQLMITVAEGVHAMAQHAGVEIAVEPNNASLWADSDRVVQTLTNLLSNAIKFSPPKTTVTLSAATAPDGTFTFRVADQGRGIPNDKLETIFERFKQVDASDSRDKGGSGLGLAICRSIVHAHGGKIWAGANGENGSVFQFTIPPRATPPPASVPKADLVTRLILVCEDDRAAMVEMKSILQRSGFSVISVTTPHEVTTRAEEIWPDAIVLDLATNSGKGWEIVEQLKANPSTREIPIVVTAIDQSSVDQSSAEGIAGWVRKPMEGDNLARAVTAACARPAILIVEDDLDLARVITTSLQSHGIKTLHAATGREAVDLCKAHQPSLIVLDLILPDIDGFAVVSTLRKNSAFSSVPLLVYSAKEVSTADQPRLRLGPTEFLTKSRCSLEDVESHIVRLLKTVTADQTEVTADEIEVTADEIEVTAIETEVTAPQKEIRPDRPWQL